MILFIIILKLFHFRDYTRFMCSSWDNGNQVNTTLISMSWGSEQGVFLGLGVENETLRPEEILQMRPWQC